MAAPTKFTRDAILDAAAEQIATAGFSGASVAAIARSIGAPSGSIYHRFASKEHLIGALWVRTASRYGDSLGDAVEEATPDDLPRRIVDHTFDWVASHPTETSLLMRFRTEDFAPGDWPEDVIAEITAVNERLANRLLSTAIRIEVDPIDMLLGAIDIPAASARRALLLDDTTVVEHIRARAIELVALVLSPSGAADTGTTKA